MLHPCGGKGQRLGALPQLDAPRRCSGESKYLSSITLEEV